MLCFISLTFKIKFVTVCKVIAQTASATAAVAATKTTTAICLYVLTLLACCLFLLGLLYLILGCSVRVYVVGCCLFRFGLLYLILGCSVRVDVVDCCLFLLFWSVISVAVIGRGNAGWTTSKSEHPCPCRNRSQGPPAEKTGRGSLLNHPSFSPFHNPDNPIGQGPN